MTNCTGELFAAYPNIDPESGHRILAEIRSIDVDSLEAGWQLYLGNAVRRAWGVLSEDQKVVAYLIAVEQQSHSCG